MYNLRNLVYKESHRPYKVNIVARGALTRTKVKQKKTGLELPVPLVI